MPPRLAMAGVLAQPGTPTRWLNNFLHVPTQDIVGCRPEDIAELERVAGRALPLAYKQWMLEAGRSVGTGTIADHFRRSFLTFPKVLEIGEVVLEVLDRPGSDESLLGRAFPFYNWEVYRIGLLDLSRPWDDPPVLMLDEHSGRADWQFRTLSQFIAWELFTLADARAMLQQRSPS